MKISQKYNKSEFKRFLDFLGVDRKQFIRAIQIEFCPPGMEILRDNEKCMRENNARQECYGCWDIYIDCNLEGQ